MGCNTSQEPKSTVGENGDVAATGASKENESKEKNGKKSAKLTEGSAKADKKSSGIKDAGEFSFL